MDDFVVLDQGGTGQIFALETVVGTVADGGELALFCGGDFFQELAGLGRDAIWGGALLFGIKQAFQRIAADQFRVDFGVGGGEGDHVHSGRLAVNDGKEANQVGEGFEDFIALAEVVFAGFENVVHGGGGRLGAGFGLEVGNAIPDFALVGVVGTGRRQAAVDGLGLLGPGPVIHDVSGFAERLGGVGPSALLCATDRDFGFGGFFEQNGGVEDAVLLGAGEFLAVNQKDGFVAPVDHQQLRDGAVGGDFCDDEVPGGEGFPEGVVLESAVRRGDERHNGDVLVRLRFTEFNRL